MPVAIVNNYGIKADTVSNTLTLPNVVRNAGEGILVGVMGAYSFGPAAQTLGVKWDPTDDNQDMALVLKLDVSTSRTFSVYKLGAPTSAKTASIVATFAPGNNFGLIVARTISGHDPAAMVRTSASYKDPNFVYGNTEGSSIASQANDLAVAFLALLVIPGSINTTAGHGDVYKSGDGPTILSSTKAGAASVLFDYAAGQSENTHIDNSLIMLSIAPAPAVADTTPPTMTGTLASSGVTQSGYTLSWSGTTRGDNVAIAGFQHSVDGVTWTDVGGVLNKTFTGKAASTLYPNYVRAYDTASPPNYSTPALTLNVTTAAPSGDVTAPNLSGSITQGAITQSSSSISWPAATDNIAVDHYEVSKDSGVTWTVLGDVLAYTFAGLAPSTTYGQRVRALDAAGNISAVLAASVTTTAAAVAGSFLSRQLVNNTVDPTSGIATASLRANQANWDVCIHDASTGGLIGSKITGLTTNSQGKLVISNVAGTVAGTIYRHHYKNSVTGESGDQYLVAV